MVLVLNMEVNFKLLCEIIKRSCCSLCYDDGEQRFYFKFNHYLDRVWEDLKFRYDLRSYNFYLEDYNNLLSRLKRLTDIDVKEQVKSISDELLLPGEILQLDLVGGNQSLKLVKMEKGQYLDCRTGNGVSLGSKICFENELNLCTSEGKKLGQIAKIHLCTPCIEHIAVSELYMPEYYSRSISGSLWEIHREAQNIVDSRRYNGDCRNLLELGKKCAINSLTFLNIINAGSNV